MVKRTLMALNDMKIKFPGKSEEEAEYILDKVSHYRRVHLQQLHRATDNSARLSSLLYLSSALMYPTRSH